MGLVVILLVVGLYNQNRREAPPSTIQLSLDQEKVYVQAISEYKCTCDACDLVLIDCHCPTALDTQKDIRTRLADGATYEDIVFLLERIYGAPKA
ncbi:MAG: hypothetical protein ACE5JP_03545 [Candidatus Bipolaricaulia bacterium]